MQNYYCLSEVNAAMYHQYLLSHISNKAFISITARCTIGRLPPALILPWGLSGFKAESPSKVMWHPVMY